MSSAVVSSAADISLEFHPPTDITQKWTDLVITDLYDYNAKHNPNYPLFLFHDGQEKKYVTWSTTTKGITRAARYAISCVGPHSKEPGKPRRTVAIIANTGKVRYPRWSARAAFSPALAQTLSLTTALSSE